jgi:AraC-like DNA-binding protein/quercetin dioxygenase-like cupin family protein
MADVNIRITIGNTIFHIISLSIGTIQHIPMHAHGNESYEIHYISSGKGTLKTKEQNYNLLPGHIYLTGPKFEHEQIGDIDDTMTEYCVYYTIQGKINSEKDSLVLTLVSQNFWFGTITPAIQSILLKLFQEAYMCLPDYKYALHFIAGELFVSLAREYRNAASFPPNKEKLSPEDKKFLIIENEFLANYVKVTPQSLSQEIGLSVRQLQRLLQQHYGMTFQQMRINARLNAACLLLNNSALSISSVSEQAGFSSVEYFSNCFRKKFHMTAQEYRKKA